MILTILYILYILIILGLIVNLLLSGVRPTKTLAWMMVLIFVPFLGIILYLSLGRNRRKFKFFRLSSSREIQDYLDRVNRYYDTIEEQVTTPEIQNNLSLAKLIIKNSNFLPSSGNSVQILVDGPDTFGNIFTAMEAAQNFIHIQYYIFEEGALADRFAEICTRKVDEGVQVRLIYDGVGSRNLSNDYINRLKEAGVAVYAFMPLHFWALTAWINYRNHRKIVVIDGKIGFTGGINVSDKYIKGDPYLGHWHDHHIRIEGPAVESLHAVFGMDWNFVTGTDELLKPPFFQQHDAEGDQTVQIVFSGPDSDFAAVRQQYFKMINDANRYIYMANSYLIPGESIIEALQTAALSGVDVRIMLPEKSDSVVVKWSIRSYFEALMEAGVKIYLYQDGFLHGKTFVVDDCLASVGTANLDIRSFEQNFEVNAVVYDRNFALQMKQLFEEDCKQSVRINPDTYRMRPVSDRLKEGAAKMLSPIL